MHLRSRLALTVALGLALGAVLAAPYGLSLAQGQNAGLELLSRATQAFEARDYDTAAQAINEAFNRGLDNNLAAKAILLRAQVNERLGHLAQAMSDYSSAMWMQNLSPAEHKLASEGKERVTAAINRGGASSQGGGFFDSLFGSSRSAEPPPQRQPEPASPRRASRAEPEPSGGGFFDRLFGFSDRQEPPKTPSPADASQADSQQPPSTAAREDKHPPSRIRVKAPAKSAGLAHRTRTGAQTNLRAAAISPGSGPSQAPTQQAQTGGAGGGYLIRFETVAGEDAAKAKAQEIKTRLRSILVGRDVSIVPAGARGGYLLAAGPYPQRNAAVSLCNAMKRQGVNCQVSP